MAVIAALKKKKETDLLYIGSKNGVERKMIERIGVRYEGVSCGKLRRYFSWENFADLFKMPVGYFEARRLLKNFGPEVVFSKGGFVSVPVVMAAKHLGIPVIAHESDLSPGLANKICFKFATKVCLSFEETRAYLKKNMAEKAIVVGNIVRKELAEGDKDSGYKFTGFDRHRPVILIMGGSQGAQQINDLVRVSLDELTKKFQIVHITGKGNLDIGVHKKGYVQYEFLEEQLKDVYAISELAVSRGGANSLAELAFLKKKVLVIPLANKASRGEQVDNASFFVRKFGWSMISGDISRENFITNIELVFKNEINSGESFKNGLNDVIKLIWNL